MPNPFARINVFNLFRDFVRVLAWSFVGFSGVLITAFLFWFVALFLYRSTGYLWLKLFSKPWGIDE